MIPRIKKHLPIAAIVLITAFATFSTLWLRDTVRVVESAAQASAVPADAVHIDPQIESMLSVRDSSDPDAIEADIRDLEFATLGEELSDSETLLGTQ